MSAVRYHERNHNGNGRSRSPNGHYPPSHFRADRGRHMEFPRGSRPYRGRGRPYPIHSSRGRPYPLRGGGRGRGRSGKMFYHQRSDISPVRGHDPHVEYRRERSHSRSNSRSPDSIPHQYAQPRGPAKFHRDPEFHKMRPTRNKELLLGNFGKPVFHQPRYDISPDRTGASVEEPTTIEERNELYTKMMTAKKDENLDEYYRYRDMINEFDRKNKHLLIGSMKHPRMSNEAEHFDLEEVDCAGAEYEEDDDEEMESENGHINGYEYGRGRAEERRKGGRCKEREESREQSVRSESNDGRRRSRELRKRDEKTQKRGKEKEKSAENVSEDEEDAADFEFVEDNLDVDTVVKASKREESSRYQQEEEDFDLADYTVQDIADETKEEDFEDKSSEGSDSDVEFIGENNAKAEGAHGLKPSCSSSLESRIFRRCENPEPLTQPQVSKRLEISVSVTEEIFVEKGPDKKHNSTILERSGQHRNSKVGRKGERVSEAVSIRSSNRPECRLNHRIFNGGSFSEGGIPIHDGASIVRPESSDQNTTNFTINLAQNRPVNSTEKQPRKRIEPPSNDSNSSVASNKQPLAEPHAEKKQDSNDQNTAISTVNLAQNKPTTSIQKPTRKRIEPPSNDSNSSITNKSLLMEPPAEKKRIISLKPKPNIDTTDESSGAVSGKRRISLSGIRESSHPEELDFEVAPKAKHQRIHFEEPGTSSSIHPPIKRTFPPRMPSRPSHIQPRFAPRRGHPNARRGFIGAPRFQSSPIPRVSGPRFRLRGQDRGFLRPPMSFRGRGRGNTINTQSIQRPPFFRQRQTYKPVEIDDDVACLLHQDQREEMDEDFEDEPETLEGLAAFQPPRRGGGRRWVIEDED